MKIEKGKWYRCIKFYGDWFTIGNAYYSPMDNHLSNNDSECIDFHELTELECNFKLVEEPST